MLATPRLLGVSPGDTHSWPFPLACLCGEQPLVEI
jgi:hypothetical protein